MRHGSSMAPSGRGRTSTSSRAWVGAAIGLALLMAGCSDGGAPGEDAAPDVVAQRPDVSPLFQPIPSEPEHPEDNPGTPERIDLGHKLFFEPKLSRSGIISCNTCHVVGAGGVDARQVAMGEGARTGPRNSPTVFNAAFLGSQFWDGRAATLEEQAKGPIQAHVEMDLTPEEAIDRLGDTGYGPLFQAAFPEDAEPLTFDNLARAIAAFERTLITPGSAFDRYLEGDTDALTDLQKQGLALFEDSGCIGCHNGVMLGGQGYAGFSHVEGAEDVGRATVTGRDEDRYVFRIAPLRNVAVTGPYFHDGSAATLHDAIAVMGSVQLGRSFEAQEVDALAAFLESLTGELPMIAYPRLPRGGPDSGSR
jgi:cytochrome c peroxidase